jgi:hypothetical protein
MHGAHAFRIAPGDRMLPAHTRDLFEAAAAGGSSGPRGER